MDQLPPDFAEAIARVIEPGKETEAARIIEIAAMLDDEELRMFLEKFASRIRDSAKPVTPEELIEILYGVTRFKGGQSSAT